MLITIEQKRLNYIKVLLIDYDGYRTVEGLKSLLDEVNDIAYGNVDDVVNEIYPD